MSISEPGPSAAGQPDSLTLAITREMTVLMKDFLGREPSTARSYLSDNLVVCLLDDTMTRVERNLAEIGGDQTVREIRQLFQGASRAQAVAAVERITGRRVVSFMFDHDAGPDVAAQIFVLASSSSEAEREALEESLRATAE